MLFIDYSSAFNTIVLSKLIIKLGPWVCTQQNEGADRGLQETAGGSPPLSTSTGAAVEKVESVKFLDVHITDDLKWSTQTVWSTQEGATVSLQPQEAEEIRFGS